MKSYYAEEWRCTRFKLSSDCFSRQHLLGQLTVIVMISCIYCFNLFKKFIKSFLLQIPGNWMNSLYALLKRWLGRLWKNTNATLSSRQFPEHYLLLFILKCFKIFIFTYFIFWFTYFWPSNWSLSLIFTI